MAKFFSAGKNTAGVLGTLMALITLAAIYFFIYIPATEKTVQERRFLCLQNIDNNIHAKIGNSFDMLNTLLDYSKKKGTLNYLKHYIDKYPKSLGTIIPIDSNQTIAVNGKKSTSYDSLATIPDLKSQQFTLRLSRIVEIKKAGQQLDTTSVNLGLRYEFKQFVKNLLPPDVFDQYIVFVSDETRTGKTDNDKAHSKLVYETFPSGLSYTSKDSLLQLKKGIISPGIRSIQIGGIEYKVFSQPVRVGNNSEWIIAGLVSAKNYQDERAKLPLWVILLLLTLAIGTIILLPWIKLYHMGNKDKLTVSDGIASVLVSMLLMSLLFFVIYNYSVHFTARYKTFTASGDTLADKITAAFTNEVNAAYDRLSQYDVLYDYAKTDINHLGKTGIQYRNNQDDSVAGVLLKKAAAGFAIDQVYWINRQGEELNNWTTAGNYVPFGNLNSREYFKKIVSKRHYLFSNRALYIQPVISRSDGTFQTVIAKQSVNDSVAVAAMSFTMKCLDNVVIPDGYQFAVIDTTGEVLYHSHAERNLNENLTKEFADSSKLVSCLVAKSGGHFDAAYYGGMYHIRVKPITGLPYFTVIFEDKEYGDARDTEAYVFTFGMLTFYLLFLAVQIGVVFLVSSKRSFFKKQLFDTSWIGPKIYSHGQYNLATLCNVVIIVLLASFFLFTSFLSFLFILLFSTTFIAIFLNAIFAIKYKKPKPSEYAYKMSAVYCLLVFVAGIDIVAGIMLETGNLLIVLAYECILTAICLVLYNMAPDALAKARYYKNKFSLPWTFTHSFAMMATTRLLITSGIPVVLFFIYSYNYEQNLDNRYRQLSFARALAKKIPVDSIDKLNGIIKGDLDTAGAYSDGVFIKKITTQKLDTIPKYTVEQKYTVKILNAFRLLNSDVEVKSNNLNFQPEGNEVIFGSLLEEHSEQHKAHTDFRAGDTGYIRFISENTNYPNLNAFFVLLLVGCVGLFYYVLYNIIRKLFALNLPSHHGWENMDAQLKSNNQLNKLLFILGSPGSGKLSKLTDRLRLNVFTREEETTLYYLAEQQLFDEKDRKEKEFKKKKMLGHDGELLVYNEKNPSKNNVYIADMILISTDCGENDPDWKKCKEEALSGYSLVIINHFEYNVRDFRANSIKLDFLESLMQRGTSKIVIISTVHPLSFLDSFTQQQGLQVPVFNPQPPIGQPAAPVAGYRIPESELERWQVLLGHFRIVIESLQISIPENAVGATPLQQTIIDETKFTHYLNFMQQITLDADENLSRRDSELVSDSLVFKLQITAHYFYTYIWQSLTKEEKFLLYDLAEDGLVNPFDDYNLTMLICKGLIIKPEGTLMLFNKGFRNFILTAIGNTELNRIKDQVKDNGKWGNLKTPLNIAIIAILGFLIVSQQESYAHIIGYITAIGAGVPAVLRIFTLVGNSGSTQKAG